MTELTPSQKHYQENAAKYKYKATIRKMQLQKIVDGLKSGPCMDCGVRYPPMVMEFDHVHGEKLGNVSEMVSRGRALSSIIEEISKCEIVCGNCHAIRTAVRNGSLILHKDGGWTVTRGIAVNSETLEIIPKSKWEELGITVTTT